MNKVITSRDNARVRHARAVRNGKVREQIFVEGVRLCEEAARAKLGIKEVFYTESRTRDLRLANLIEKLRRLSDSVTPINEKVMDALAETKTPQGIVLIAAKPQTGRLAAPTAQAPTPLLVIMHRLNNPANAGAILRTAEAAGATGVMTTTETSDVFSPTALRGAMGASFRLPIWTGASLAEALAWCKEQGIRTIAAAVWAEHTHWEIDWTQPSALLVGSEGHGLKAEEVAIVCDAFRIEMRPPVESLNVAVAASVALYEAARQRL